MINSGAADRAGGSAGGRAGAGPRARAGGSGRGTQESAYRSALTVRLSTVTVTGALVDELDR